MQDAGRPCNPKIILHILPLAILFILFSSIEGWALEVASEEIDGANPNV